MYNDPLFPNDNTTDSNPECEAELCTSAAIIASKIKPNHQAIAQALNYRAR